MGPLSEDLRKRVVSAVCEEGMSCRGSARRFGVSSPARSVGWRRCTSVAAMRRCGWAAIRVHSASRRTRIFCLAFIGASPTLRSTKSAMVCRVRQARGCRHR